MNAGVGTVPMLTEGVIEYNNFDFRCSKIEFMPVAQLTEEPNQCHH